MGIDSIVNVIVNTTAVNLSRAGFGNMALLASHSFWPELVRQFGTSILTELVEEGVPVTHPIYLMAAAARAQNPAVGEFYVLRRTRPPTQKLELVPGTPMEGDVYSVTIDGTAVSVTADASPTVATICTALTTAFAALTDLTAADGVTKVTLSGVTPGVLHPVADRSKNLGLADTTTDPGIASDLADAANVSSAWYGLQIDSQSKAEILGAAGWVESNGKLFVPSSADDACLDPASTTDAAAAIKTANYARTMLVYHPEPEHYMGARWMGKQFPKDAGSTDWAHQRLSGKSYVLTGAQVAALEAKKANFFVATNGISATFWGSTGSGEWIDTTHFADWMKARTQERIYALLLGLEKLPYTQEGLEALGAELRAQFFEGIKAGGIDGASAIVIEVPKAADIDAAVKASRVVPGIRGSGFLAGAVNRVDPLTITLAI